MKRATLLLVLALAACDSTSSPPTPPPPIARGAIHARPSATDPYAGPPKSDAPGEKRASGLVVRDLTVGTGATADTGKRVTVDYHGWLNDGSTFDTSRKKEPFSFTLGAGKVIKGWEEGVPGMKVGGLRRLTVPSELAYGNRAVGRIPAGATLTFDIELLAVE